MYRDKLNNMSEQAMKTYGTKVCIYKKIYGFRKPISDDGHEVMNYPCVTMQLY